MDNISKGKFTDIGKKEAIIILSTASLVTALLCVIFLNSLPPAYSFFEGFGRISLIYIPNAIILRIGYRIFRPGISVPITELLAGIMLASFFGTIIGVIIGELADSFGISF